MQDVRRKIASEEEHPIHPTTVGHLVCFKVMSIPSRWDSSHPTYVGFWSNDIPNLWEFEKFLQCSWGVSYRFHGDLHPTKGGVLKSILARHLWDLHPTSVGLQTQHPTKYGILN